MKTDTIPVLINRSTSDRNVAGLPTRFLPIAKVEIADLDAAKINANHPSRIQISMCRTLFLLVSEAGTNRDRIFLKDLGPLLVRLLERGRSAPTITLVSSDRLDQFNRDGRHFRYTYRSQKSFEKALMAY
jgi:hypothetical protein